MPDAEPRIVAIDLFCGAGGLAFGLQQAGIPVIAGVDVDHECKFAFETNIAAPFLEMDVRDVGSGHLSSLWGDAGVRLLAGCAPCTPFSPYRRGVDTTREEKWPLLDEFARLVGETEPDLVTMENVPRIQSATVFLRFVERLRSLGYQAAYGTCSCLDFGLAQTRRRLVLLASRLGEIGLPRGGGGGRRTVRQEIGGLPALASGAVDPQDDLHRARSLSETNLRRIRASKPGGTWKDWPPELRAPCHRRATGASFRNVYARMEWDEPSPTITTMPFNFGTGRFGHPDQDRALTLREAAMLQGFPRDYRFVREGAPVRFSRMGALIGNAVPPPLGRAIGELVLEHVAATCIGAGNNGQRKRTSRG
jgi:DNA (cytosine-5)-methyltransferase 1